MCSGSIKVRWDLAAAAAQQLLPLLYTLAAIAVARLLWRYYRQLMRHNVPALPGGKPLIGHTLMILRNIDRILTWQLDTCQQMNWKTFCFTIPTVATYYIVTDPTCLEYILRTHNDSFIKGPIFHRRLSCLVGDAITTSDNEQWLWQRKLASSMFSEQRYAQHLHVLVAKLDLLSAILAKAAVHSTAVDLHQLLHSFTMDSYCASAFGADAGCLTHEGEVPFAAAFDKAQQVIQRRFLVSGWQLIELLDGTRVRLNRDVATLRHFAADIINKRRQLLSDNSTASKMAAESSGDSKLPDDLLSHLLAGQRPDGRPLTDKQLTDLVLNLLLAGRDTTAQAISWTLYHLLHHPECEAKVIEEVTAVLGPLGSPAAVTYDNIKQLVYTRACFLEALRLNPTAPSNVRYASEDHVLPDGSYIPRGAQVVYNIYCINRMPSFWGPTADQFRPERWIELESMPSLYSYLSFNAGARMCLGQRLAELEGVFVLAGLLSRFKLKQKEPGKKITYQVAITMPMKDGLSVYVQHRAKE